MNLSSYLFLLRYSLAKRGAISQFKDVMKHQYLDLVKLNALSWNKTEKLIHEAYENVPWYREQFEKIGLHPNDIKTERDFVKIPLLHRVDLVENYEKFISKKANPKKLKISTTGGSTGTPVKLGMQRHVIRELQKWQMFSWWGLSPNVNMATIYRGLPARGVRKFILDFINWPQKIIQLDATNITEENIKKFIESSQKYKPQLIHGYVGAVDAIADYMLENNIQIPAPKAIWLTAAPVTKIQESKISKAFNAPVCDQYGCSELYFIASECPHKKGLHIFSDAVKVEVLDDNNEAVPNGVYGKIVLTNLNDYHFPLIRYENGDVGRLLDTKCSCGMTLPLLDKIKGRVSQKIVLPDGLILAGEYLTCLFDDFTDEVKQFQVIQRKDASVDVNILFHIQCSNKQLVIDAAFNELMSRIKNKELIRVNEVDEIVNSKGKLNFIVSEL